jgi:hypothetical protein
MVKFIVALVLGIVIGHFGPIYVGKMTLHGTSFAMASGAKILDSANKMVK